MKKEDVTLDQIDNAKIDLKKNILKCIHEFYKSTNIVPQEIILNGPDKEKLKTSFDYLVSVDVVIKI